MVEGFDSIDDSSINYFETLFQEDKNISLPDIMKIAKKIPSFVSIEDNDHLMDSVSITELQVVLALCKNDKILDLDGIPIEIYRTLFDVLGSDLLRVVDDSRVSGKIPVIFNTTLVALIPKSDFPKSFEDFSAYLSL